MKLNKTSVNVSEGELPNTKQRCAGLVACINGRAIRIIFAHIM